MLKNAGSFLMIALLAMPLVAVTGCGSSNSVEIPTDPVPKSPGRPTGTNEGDGAKIQRMVCPHLQQMLHLNNFSQ